ncbi:T-cell surface antigen CD2-like [Cololabis saira]|uniref:T-cell surface antigen CD2-like n=1 Tax=Cololabis saira TaxID=129043 RepID=UPI002AD473C0|nr:T-cell surface antigen CD2-like [Cololabis saira]
MPLVLEATQSSYSSTTVSGEFTSQSLTEELLLETMIQIIIIILGTTAVTKGSMECNLTGPAESQLCFGAVGKPLIFNLPINKTLQMKLMKNNSSILTLSDKKGEVIDKYRSISTLLNNGAFRINCVTRDDAGDYELEIYSSSGHHVKRVNVHLKIIEPVSDPNVSQTCLSPEQMNISCSAEGDGVKFTLSLDDNELMQTREGSTGKLNVSNVSFILHGQLVGKLVCRVQNDVSSEQTSIQLTSCNDVASLPTGVVAVAVTAGVVSLLLVPAVFLCKKHFRKRTTKPTTVKDGDAEDEIVYSDVRVTPAARKMHR